MGVQEEYYNSLYKNNNDRRDVVSYVQFTTKVKSILNTVRKDGIQRPNVLELGCGDGLLTALLLKEGFRVTAVDISTEAIRKIAKKFESAVQKGDLIAVNSDILNLLRNSEGPYDLIIGTGILHHIERIHFSDLFKLVYSRLSDGSFLAFVTEPNGRKAYRFLWEKAAPLIYKFYNYDYKWEVEKGSVDIDIPVIRNMMQENGFRKVTIKSYQTIPIFQLRILHSLNRMLEKICSSEYSLYISILAEK